MKITTVEELAAHLGAPTVASDVTMTRESKVMPMATFHWDGNLRLVSVRAPIAAAVFDGLEPGALAVRVSDLNRRLPVMGLEVSDGFAFVSHAFFDGDGVHASTIDCLVQAIGYCERALLDREH